MTKTKFLDTASGALFFAGFLFSKLQYIPFAPLSIAVRCTSLLFYLGGYSAWFLSSYIQEEHTAHKTRWYGFAKIKIQFLVSSFIGFVATVLSIAAIFMPILLPPAAWLFLLGNIIWGIGEYHKLKKPPKDATLTPAQQKAYVDYAITTIAISLISAVAATLIFLFPPIAAPLTIFSLLLCTALGALAFELWLKSTISTEKEKNTLTDSYLTMSHDLNHTPAPTEELTKAPYHSKEFFPDIDSSEQNANLIEMLSVVSAEHDSQTLYSPL